jgi:outer membrane PBP1 activator LpoA protein
MMNKAKKLSSNNGYKFLREAFAAEQNALKSRLELANQSITHSGELGAVNEQSFIDFLWQNLPQRYAVNSAIILNSEGKSSDQIDVVIHDRFYSSTLLSQNKRALVPDD